MGNIPMKFTDHYEGYVIVRDDGALFEKITVDDRGRYSASEETVVWTPKIQKAEFFQRVSSALRTIGKVNRIEQSGKTQPLPIAIKRATMHVSAELTAPDYGPARE